jgi:T5SS/PEP-CTERM-associated repeat protein
MVSPNTYVWNGGSGSFTDATQWTDETDPDSTGFSFPGTIDTAIISGGEITGPEFLELDFGSPVTLTVSGDVTFDTGVGGADVTTNTGDLIVTSDGGLAGGVITNSGTITGAGAVGADSVTNSGIINVSFLEAVTSGQPPLVNTGEITVNQLEVTGGTLINQGTLTAATSLLEDPAIENTGELQIGGFVGANTLSNTGTIIVGTLFASDINLNDSAAPAAFAVDGAAALLEITSGGLNITDGALILSSAGSLSTAGTDEIGFMDGFSERFLPGTVSLQSGANWTSANDIQVGYGTLALQGGTLTSTVLQVGYDFSGLAAAQLVSATGSSSKWTNSGSIVVGANGSGTLALSAGASLTVQGDVIAGQTAGGAGTITLDGEGTTLQVGANLIVGQNGAGSLALSNNASLTVEGTLQVGGATATGIVTDSGSDPHFDALAINNGVANVGPGTTNAWFVDLGAAQNIDVGGVAGVTGTLNLPQTATVVAGSGTVTIGGQGTGILNLAATALFDAAVNDVTVGDEQGSNGQITVSGTGALLQAGNFTAGDTGAAQVTVNGGGDLQVADTLTVGDNSSGATIDNVTITDSGSSAQAGGLTVGGSGTGTLLVSGATLTVTGDGAVGDESSGKGSFTVNAGSASVSGTLTVGATGNGLVLVGIGGTLVANTLQIGNQLGGKGEVDVTGAKALLTDASVSIGSGGKGTLKLTGGEVNTTGNVDVADQLKGSVQSVTVDQQSLWTVGGTFTVAEAGIATTTIKGASLLAVNGDVVVGDQAGAGGVLTVTGTLNTGGTVIPSEINYAGALIIGNAGDGALTISAGGKVAASNGGEGLIEIAALAGETSSVTVTGAGSVLTGSDLIVGGGTAAAGGTGTLTVASGGLVQAANVQVWNGGHIKLSGGTLDTDPLTVAAGGTIDGNGVVGGAISDAGVIDAANGSLVVTGSVTGGGTLGAVGGGTLDLQGSAASNVTLAFGSSDATLLLGPSAGVPGTIVGFGSNDRIGFDNQTVSSFGYNRASGVLTIDGGAGGTVSVTLAGTYAQSDFALVGGQLVTPPSTWTWIGGTNVSSSAADWSLTSGPGNANAIPAPGDSVLIASGTVEDGLSELDGQGNITIAAGVTLAVTAANDGIVLGPSEGAAGTLAVTGAAALLSVATATQGVTIGNAGTGAIQVEQGGSLVAAAVALGGLLTGPGGGVGTLALTGSSDAQITGALALWGASTISVDASSGLDVGTGGNVAAGAILVETGRTVAGSGTLAANLVNDGTVAATNNATLTLSTGGLLEVTGTISGTGAFDIAPGATLRLDGVLDSGQTINFLSGTAETLVLNSPSAIAASSITGFGAGAGDEIVLNGGLLIGQSGDNTLTVSGGTLLFAGTSNDVGGSAGANGVLTVLNGGTVLATQAAGSAAILQIGASGASGTEPAANGAVLVSGTGSVLDLDSNGLAVGDAGSGALTVAQGATVNAGVVNAGSGFALAAGLGAGGQASIAVTGFGSVLNLTGSVTLGQAGSAALTVGGGTVNIINAATGASGLAIGQGPATVAGTGGQGQVSVTAGGTIADQGGIQLGGNGVSGALTVNTGGEVLAGTSIVVGTATEVSGTVYGGTGVLTIGAGGTVALTEASQDSSSGLLVGTDNSSVNGRTDQATGDVTVTGSGAVLNTNLNPIAVGLLGDGLLTVGQGGTVEAGTSNSSGDPALSVGRQGDGNVVIDDGSLQADGDVYIGRAGNGNLLVENDGSLGVGLDGTGSTTDAELQIGGAGPAGGTLLYTGGSGGLQVTSFGKVTSLLNVAVGLDGTEGDLSINQGGAVTTDQQVLIGLSTTIAAGGTILAPTGTTVLATATVEGGAGSVDIGPGGTLASTLPLVSGTSGIVIGDGTGATGDVTVHGAGALLTTNGNRLGVGSAGVSSLVVSQGASVAAGTGFANNVALYIAANAGATAAVTVTDPGSTLTAVGQINVGQSGNGSLLIENAAAVFSGGNTIAPSQGFDVGTNAGGSGLVTVAGTLSLLSNTGAFIVGDAGLGDLTVSAGADVDTSSGSVSGLAGLVIANTASAAGSSINVTGTGSGLTVTGLLDVGAAGFGQLSVAQGATVSATSLTEGAAAGGSGIVAVSGAGSVLNVTGVLNIGGLAPGQLSIENGGEVTAGSVTIGSNAGGDGNLVIGTGTTLLVTGTTAPVVIGVGSIAAVLNIQGGTLMLSGSPVFGTDGRLVQVGGAIDPAPTLSVANASFSGGAIDEASVEVLNTATSVSKAPDISGGSATFLTPLVTGGSVSKPGIWNIDTGGTLVLDVNSVGATQEFTFADNTGVLEIGQQVSVDLSGTPQTIDAAAIAGFQGLIDSYVTGDQIIVDTTAAAGFAYGETATTITVNDLVSGNPTGAQEGALVFTDAGAAAQAFADLTNAAPSLVDQVVPCFAAGTRIETVSGPRAVETLREDDEIRTLLGGAGRIGWIGTRTVNCARHSRPEKVWPIRVCRNAFGPSLPKRDLYLSPDHAVYVNDVLIPVRLLVNGTTIRQVERVSVTYYHVELDQHDVILAEGLPVESYLDTGDRSNFSNGGGPMRLFPDFSAPSIDLATMWEAKGCASLIVWGPPLEAVQRRVNALSAASARTKAVARAPATFNGRLVH